MWGHIPEKQRTTVSVETLWFCELYRKYDSGRLGYGEWLAVPTVSASWVPWISIQRSSTSPDWHADHVYSDDCGYKNQGWICVSRNQDFSVCTVCRIASYETKNLFLGLFKSIFKNSSYFCDHPYVCLQVTVYTVMTSFEFSTVCLQ